MLHKGSLEIFTGIQEAKNKLEEKQNEVDDDGEKIHTFYNHQNVKERKSKYHCGFPKNVDNNKSYEDDNSEKNNFEDEINNEKDEKQKNDREDFSKQKNFLNDSIKKKFGDKNKFLTNFVVSGKANIGWVKNINKNERKYGNSFKDYSKQIFSDDEDNKNGTQNYDEENQKNKKKDDLLIREKSAKKVVPNNTQFYHNQLSGSIIRNEEKIHENKRMKNNDNEQIDLNISDKIKEANDEIMKNKNNEITKINDTNKMKGNGKIFFNNKLKGNHGKNNTKENLLMVILIFSVKRLESLLYNASSV